MVSSINQSLNFVETGFNIVGNVPIAGVVSGVVRALIGKIQCLAAIILVGITGIGLLVSGGSRRWENRFTKSGEHALHGLLNITRGYGEAMLALTVIGSLFMLIPNLLNPNKFTPFFHYGIFAV